MPYNIEKTKGLSGSKIVFKKGVAGKVLVTMLILLGTPIFFFGLLAALGSKPDETLTAFLVMGFGGVFASAGFLFFTSAKTPNQFVFDNDYGVLRIEEAGKGKKPKETLLPYQEIQGFEVRTRHRSSGGSNGSIAYNELDIVKNDGAFWTLSSSRNADDAMDLCRHLEQHVHLDKEFAGDEVTPINDRFKVSQKGDSTIVSWSARADLVMRFFTLCIFLSFISLLYGALGTSTAFWVAGGFMSLLGILMIVSTLLSFGQTQYIECNDQELKSYQKGGLFKMNTFSIPISDLNAIRFNFTTDKHESVLHFVTHTDREQYDRFSLGQVDMSDLGNIIGMIRQVKRINLERKTMGDILYLEQLLQHLIEERTGHRPA